MTADLAPGTLIGGDFQIVELLGRGGMGSVYVAEQLSTGKRRALKVMRSDLVTDGRSRQRFIEEAKVGSRIESAHVVEVIAAGVDPSLGVPWLAMELLKGVDLEGRIAERGPLSLGELVDLYEQLAHALGEAHAQGVIHRDLKPENLFLAESRRVGDKPVLKILDFGIATFVASDKTAATVTSAIGSPLWIAPEQMSAGAHLRPSTDVWAMGLIAFYLLTGKSYWPAANVPSFSMNALVGDILAHPLVPASQRARELGVPPPPRGFDAWFERCVARDPAARFENAALAAQQLKSMTAGAQMAFAPTAQLGQMAPQDPSTGPLRAPGATASSPAPVAPAHHPSDSGPAHPGPAASQAGSWQQQPVGRTLPLSHPDSGPVAAPTWSAPEARPVERGSGRRGVVLLGVVLMTLLVLAGGAAVVGVIAVGNRTSDTDDFDEDVLAEQEFREQLRECQEALDELDLPPAREAADRARVLRPDDPEARECQEVALALTEQEQMHAEGTRQLDEGDLSRAYITFDSLPPDSPFRERPPAQDCAVAYAEEQLNQGREAIEREPIWAIERAELVLDMWGATDEQREVADELRRDAEERQRRLTGEPEPHDEAEPDGELADDELDAEARGCALRGDNRCVIELLEGRARTERQLVLLIEAYRSTGQQARAIPHMEHYVRRFPDSPRARSYRQILSRL